MPSLRFSRVGRNLSTTITAEFAEHAEEVFSLDLCDLSVQVTSEPAERTARSVSLCELCVLGG
jgi:hypothetical protein